MSWLLFMDESGHDHQQMPYEVRGGMAIHASKLWPFVLAAKRLELDCFGCELAQYKKEIKGCRLINKKRMRLAGQKSGLPHEQRRRLCRTNLTKGLEGKPPAGDELTAYGQACVLMADGLFQLMRDHQVKLFASAIPRGVKKPKDFRHDEFLRKDHVFLFERYFYFLETEQEHGLIVMDEVEKTLDRKFVRQLEKYFTHTTKGRYRSSWIVPTPMFVASDMTYAVQAADLAIYCLNWGFRIPQYGMNADVRQEITDRFSAWIGQLQFRGQGYDNGKVVDLFGVVYVPDPYQAR